MRKKLLISMASAMAMLAAAAGISSIPVSASTGYDLLIDDDFEAASVLDTDKWNPIAEESGASFSATTKNVLAYDLYHGQSISTKDKVTVADTDCLLIEFDLESIDVEGGFWSITYGSATTDLNAAAQTKGFNFYGASRLFYGTSCTFPTYDAAKNETLWIAWERKGKVQIYIHPDGSQEIYQNTGLVAYVKASDATAEMKERSGYLGLSFIGPVATAHVVSEMNYFKAGTFAESLSSKKEEGTGYPGRWVAAPATGITWTVDDSAPTEDGLSDLFVSTQKDRNVGGWITKNNCVEVATAAGSLVSKKSVPEADARIEKTFSLSAKLDTKGLRTATAKLSFGGAAAGVYKKEEKYYLAVWNGDAVAAEKEVSLSDGEVRVTGFGNKNLEIVYNGVTVFAKVDSFAGVFSLDVTAGAVSVKLDNVILTAASGYEHKGGVSVAADFSSAINEEDWYVGSSGMPDYANSGVSVRDGALEFRNAQDGSMLASANEYQNFVFTFDITYLEREGEEDEEGNIIRPVSTWLGVVYGAPEKTTMFGSQPMLYFSNSLLDLLNTTYPDGSTRKWLTTAENIFNADYSGKTVSVRLEARDGTVCFSWYLKEANGDKKLGEVTLYDQDTLGHISVQCTRGGNFSIDNARIVNTDDVADYTLTRKTVEKTEISLFTLESKTGAIELGDMKNKTAKFALAAAVEGFTMNEDGTYFYTAPATEPQDKIVVNYTAAIDDWDLLGYAPVGDASKYTLNGTIEITVKAPAATGIEVAAPTKLSYANGEELDLTGMVVRVVYENGEKVTLTEGAEGYAVDKSAYLKNTAGTYAIKIKFGAFEKSFDVTVAAKQPVDTGTSSVKVKSGCGSVAGLGAVFSLAALGAAIALGKKKKD